MMGAQDMAAAEKAAGPEVTEKAPARSALISAVAAKDRKLAAKMQALHDLYAGLEVDDGGRRPLTEAEAAVQRKNALSAEETIAMQKIEYGTWEATGPIDVGNARAYNEGDPVPISNVEAHGYEAAGLVRRQKTGA